MKSINKIDIQGLFYLYSYGSRIRINKLISEDEKWIDKTIIIAGWIRSIRVLGNGDFAFIEINDGSCVKHFQIVISSYIENYGELLNDAIGSCLMVKGKIISSSGKKQSIEMQVDDNNYHFLRIMGKCDTSNYKLVKSKDKIKLEVIYIELES